MADLSDSTRRQLRSIPSVSRLLEHDAVRALEKKYARRLLVRGLQHAVAAARHSVLGGASNGRIDDNAIVESARRWLENSAVRSLRPVINATGVVLHTGLGRAPLCTSAIDAVARCAAEYSNLELNLDTGARGRRADHVAAQLAELTGAESATVVNNNAAATLLVLNTLAKGREVIVSRGELVEIGGSFRLPEIMTASGAVLREVGATNRTRIGDYERSVNDATAALLKVHTSNYHLTGFTESTPLGELVQLGRRCGRPVIHDLGSGALFDITAIGAPAEPDASTSIATGADLVCFSGDKILGGPQVGIILGRGDWVRRIESNPLARTYRVGKLTLAALEATLAEYRDIETAARNIPALMMLRADSATLAARANDLAARLRHVAPGESFDVIEDASVAGGGSMPQEQMKTHCVAWAPARYSVDRASAALRAADPPVIARVRHDTVLFDPRTILSDELSTLVGIVARLCAG